MPKILHNDEVLLEGDPTSIHIIYRNLKGRNQPPLAPGTYRQYLDWVSWKTGVAINPRRLKMVM